MCSSSVRRNDVVVVVWWLDWLRADRLTACKKNKIKNKTPPPTTPPRRKDHAMALALRTASTLCKEEGWLMDGKRSPRWATRVK